MKTKEDMLKFGYEEGWSTECPKCKSYNCHAFSNVITCFDYFHKEPIQNKHSKLPSSVWDKFRT